MEFAEQTISSAKLEKLRQDAVKKTKTLKRVFPLCLILYGVMAVLRNWTLFLFVCEYGWGDPATKGALLRLLGSLIMAVILAGGVRIFYSMLVWQKAYNLFNFSYKNKYVLETLKKRPGFSDLNYNAAGGFSYEELKRMNLIPKGSQVFYQSTDKLTGLLDGARFCCSNVQTGRRPRGRRSLPDILFEGQVIAFSTFDERKLSSGFVQVFSKKALSQVRDTAAPLQIHTENSLFNENFVVFAENEQNAFYILTPPVLEQIVAFQEVMEGSVYLAFYQSALYVTCSQFRNPFDAYVDIPVEKQLGRIDQDIKILQSAREILVRASDKNEKGEA